MLQQTYHDIIDITIYQSQLFRYSKLQNMSKHLIKHVFNYLYALIFSNNIKAVRRILEREGFNGKLF